MWSYPFQNYDNQLCINLCGVASQPQHKCITPALYFASPKLKCFCYLWLTLLLPPAEFCPQSPVSKRWRTFSSYWSFSSRRAKTNGHIKDLAQKVPLTAIAGVCMCEHVNASAWKSTQIMLTRSVASQHEWKNYTVFVFVEVMVI